jgi:glycosyltransferase involved in cell wall biosynthesis
MNIVLYVNSFLPGVGGRELVVYHLAHELKELGNQVRVIGPAGWWRDRKYKLEFPVHRFPTLRIQKPWRKRLSAKERHAERYKDAPGWLQEHFSMAQLLVDTSIWGCDVVHAHNTYPTGYRAARLKRLRNVPLVVTPHGEDIHKVREMNFGLRLNSHISPKIEYAVENADILTAISAAVEESLIDAGSRRGKIRLVPNGVDLNRYANPISVDVREWLKLPANSRIITTIGNYHPRKGQEVIIRAMKTVVRSDPNACLVIIGRKPDPLRPLIHELGLKKNVVLTGQIKVPSVISSAELSVDNQQIDWLAAILQSSEIYVSAGVNEGAEGLSLAVLEAMASGLPIVASNISGNRDVVKPELNGVLVTPGDPEMLASELIRILKNETLARQLSEGSHTVARDYSWNSIAKQYMAIYQEARARARTGK